MIDIEKITRKNSERNMVLKYMKKHKAYWHTPRAVINALLINMTDASLGRRFREDAGNCILNKRMNKCGYVEFKWGGK